MPIEINNKELRLMKAHVSANYKSKTVLSNSAFDYVDLWLKSQPGDKYREAGFKHNRKLFAARELKEERVEKFKELLSLMEEYKRKNQYE